MSRFAILRVEKIKSFGELRGRGKHNSRDTDHGIEHCDPERRPFKLHHGTDDAERAWRVKTHAAGIKPQSVRKNAVVALEWIATASPDFFKNGITKERLEQWTADSLAFIEQQSGGKQNTLTAFVHWDETTPHLQVLTAPIVRKEIRGREQPRLSAKDLIGGHRSRLEELQTDYAAAVAEHGLERGRPRKTTGERNKRPAVWREEQRRAAEKAAQAAERQRQAAEQAEQHTAAAASEREAAERDRSKAAHLLSKAREHLTTLTAAAAAGQRFTERTLKAMKAVKDDSQNY